MEKHKFACKYCGRSPPEVSLELEHIIPRCKGGSNELDNLAPACWDCNHGKQGNLLKEEIKDGQ